MFGDDLRDALGAALPTDASAQSNALAVLRGQLLAQGNPQPLVLDVGCGRGDGIDFVRSILPQAYWLGVDIEQSAEVDERPLRDDAQFRTFDGESLPVESDSVDIAYSQQVFEHVARPEPLLADIARVLKPGGIFCGSVSQLEAFHSRSVGGFTTYGWRLAVERAGMRLVEVRPGIDAGTLLLRRAVRRSERFDRYWIQESPGNRAMDLVARIKKLDAAQRNALKLMFAGQFTFVVQRPHA